MSEDAKPQNEKLLARIDSPADLRGLSREQLPALADELRDFIVNAVSRTGGHLSSNLGTVELTIALHYVFNTPRDRLVWDVGHQSYPHKILTGRRDQMATLRQYQGLSGFPRRTESEYDTFGVGHSSTSIAAAMGMAVASRNLGENQGPERRRHVAVIGDGAMSAGMAFEALNNAGVMRDVDLLVILNDNDMSISPAVGAMNHYLARILSARPLVKARDVARQMLSVVPPMYELARKLEEHAKGMLVPATLFEELGFTYFGPIDGHDLDALVPTLQNLREMHGPLFLHVITRKGQGYKLAESDPVLYHGPGKFDPAEGIKRPLTPPTKPTYTQVFSDWVCDMAEVEPRLVAVTPAMREGSGLVEFEKRFPQRYFDVGIAEQHAVTFAAGMACDGLVPVQKEFTELPRGKAEVRRQGKRIAILAFGSMVAPAMTAGEALNATVVNMRFVKPIDADLIRELAATHDAFVTVEEHVVMGGAGSACLEVLAEAGIEKPVLQLGLPDRYIEHGEHALLLRLEGLDGPGIEKRIRERFPEA